MSTANNAGKLLFKDKGDYRHLLHREKFEALTEKQHDNALSLREGDIEDAPIGEYFGRGSNAQKAQRLATDNPVAYALLRQRAVKEGLIA